MAWSKEENDEQVAETQENNSEATQKQLAPSPPFKPNIANLENVTEQTANSEFSRLRYKRPASSYGIRSQPKPLINRPYEDPLDFREFYSNPPQMHMEPEITVDEEELFAKNVVHKGDRVMIQSQVVGKDCVCLCQCKVLKKAEKIFSFYLNALSNLATTVGSMILSSRQQVVLAAVSQSPFKHPTMLDTTRFLH